MKYGLETLSALAIVAAGALQGCPAAHADGAEGDINTLGLNNKRLNDGVVDNVFTVQHQAGCANDVRIDPQLRLAAQQHTDDLLNNTGLDGDIGSDGSTPQDRANAAGYHGQVAETVAINPAMAISSLDLISRWYNSPSDFATMSNCANSQMGVWSENRLDRTVVVAVYGHPQPPADTSKPGAQAAALGYPGENVPIGPSPDYDGTGELEFGAKWFGWILRGVYPPPAYPSQ
jgi:Cysteine-rich secretory protein family